MSEQYYKLQSSSKNYGECYDTEDDTDEELIDEELLLEEEIQDIYNFIDEVRHDTVFPFLDKLTFSSLLDFLKSSESL